MGDAAGTAEKERAAKIKEIFQQVVHALLKRVPDPQKDQLKEKVKNHVNKLPNASPDVFPHLFAAFAAVLQTKWYRLYRLRPR